MPEKSLRKSAMLACDAKNRGAFQDRAMRNACDSDSRSGLACDASARDAKSLAMWVERCEPLRNFCFCRTLGAKPSLAGSANLQLKINCGTRGGTGGAKPGSGVQRFWGPLGASEFDPPRFSNSGLGNPFPEAP